MNYPKLTLDGKEYPLCFKVGAIRIMKKEFGIDFIEMLSDLKNFGAIAEKMPMMVYAAAVCYCSVEKKPVDFTLEDITAALDGMGMNDYTPALTVINEEYVKVLSASESSAEVKKEKAEPFLVGEDRTDMPRPDDDAPVGAGLVHISRPAYQTEGVQ